jgi:predicted enzyme related to lactoylglutathione lyase
MQHRRSGMAQKLTHAPIVVRDQDKALRFYTEALGFEKRQDHQRPGHPRWLTVAPKGQEVEFILVKGEHATDPRALADAESGGNHWALQTDDCRKDVEALKARGVRFTEPAPMEAPFGVVACFADPDGNRFSLLQPAQNAWKG